MLLLSATTARAQYTDNNQTNTITGGVISNWTAYSGSYYVGTIFSYDVLIITNASTLNNTNGYLGYSTSSSNNAVTVTGSGSVWTNRSDLNVGYQGAGNTLTNNTSGLLRALQPRRGL
ncbi:MAG: hypothetical protein NTY53_21140 [Kiritimatiellaeota bacterium]|nr:hypothetical protein [Kiritimatiellota bacterium]